MPATYNDQFYAIDPFSPPASGTTLLVFNYDITDADDNDEFSPSGGDTLDGTDITGVYDGDSVTVEHADGSVHTIFGVTFYLADGRRFFTPDDGSVLEDATFNSSTWVAGSTHMDVDTLGPPCFTPGTLIETKDGPVKIDDLNEGDLILTQSNGFQPLIMKVERTVSGLGEHQPIRFMVGAIENSRELIVSPQHRMLVTGWRAELFFGESEVLVAARHLVNGDTIVEHPMDEVRYIHLVLENHEVIFAEDCPTESFDMGGDLALYDRSIQSGLRDRNIIMERVSETATAKSVMRRHEAFAMLH